MKGRNLVFTSALILVAGIILIITRQSINSDGIVTSGGILFILAGLLNILAFDGMRRKTEGKREAARGMMSSTFNWLSSAAAIMLGICMLIFKSTFISLVPAMFGILVAFAAFYQLYVLAVGVRPNILPVWFYIVPMGLAGTAVYLFTLKPVESDLVIMLTTGIALAVFGAAGVAEGLYLGYMRRADEKAEISASEPAESASEATVDEPKPLDAHADESHSSLSNQDK